MSEHMPWHNDGGDINGVWDSEGSLIVSTRSHGRYTNEEDESRAEFIARACNAHEDLLAACKKSMSLINYLRLESQESPSRTMEKELGIAIAKAEKGDDK